MSLERGIRRFLDDVDPVILARGEEYYHSGRVESVDWEENHATAEVSGSEEEPYLVELDFSEDGAVEECSCDCPYDWGPVCKHTVAALLAVQAKPPKKAQKKAAGKKADIRALVERASKERLAALVLEHCQEDRRFQSQVAFELSASGEQKLAAVEALIKASIGANKRQGYIDMRGCDNICADLDDVLDKVHVWIVRGQYEQAMDVTLFVLLTAMKLAGEADSSSGSLSWTVDAAVETAELAARGLARDGGPRGKLVGEILKTAENPVFDGWEHWRYDLLTEAGRWREEYPGFLAELKAVRPAYEYMEILKREGETDLLMERVRLHPETVFSYGNMLARTYKNEIFELCIAVIRERAEQSNNRKEYQRLCALIESLAEFGGQGEARSLIIEFRQTYPRRPALLDELRLTEELMAKKHM